MATRDYGSGSIIARGDAWYLRWYVVDPLTGRRVRRVETFHGTKKAAQARLAEHTTRSGLATAGDGSTVTLAACIDHWLRHASHEPTTSANYDLARRTVPEHVMVMPISTIRAPMLAELIAAIADKHNVHRARLVHALISGALTQAWRWEWIADNPARRVTPPAAPRRAKTAPTPAQVRALLAEAAHDPQLHCWLLLSADLGSRRSELRSPQSRSPT